MISPVWSNKFELICWIKFISQWIRIMEKNGSSLLRPLHRCGSVLGKHQDHPWFPAWETHQCCDHWQTRQLHPSHSLQTAGNIHTSCDFQLPPLHSYRVDPTEWHLFWSWQMIFLLELCSLDIPHSVLLKSFSSLVELLKSLSTDTGDIFSKVCLGLLRHIWMYTVFHKCV